MKSSRCFGRYFGLELRVLAKITPARALCGFAGLLELGGEPSLSTGHGVALFPRALARFCSASTRPRRGARVIDGGVVRWRFLRASDLQGDFGRILASTMIRQRFAHLCPGSAVSAANRGVHFLVGRCCG